MKDLDIEALLEKNQQVDRDVIKARQEKIARLGPVKPKGRHIISPYGGRRVALDDKVNSASVRRLPRAK